MGDDKKKIGNVISGDPEMVGTFIAEAKEHLDAVEDDFLTLEKQKDKPNRALLDKVFRAIHSVKGAAGFLGLKNMTTLGHTMETLLGRMRTGEIRPESEYIDALLAGVDLLAAMLDDVEHSNEVDMVKVHDRLTKLVEQEQPVRAKEEESVTPQIGEKQPPEPAAEQIAETSVQDKGGTDFGNTVRIHVDMLDKLMVQAGELVQVRNRYLLSVDDSDSVSRSISKRLDMVTSDLQDTIIRTRMQPIGKILGKFPRIVRELGNKLGKRIEITITGSEAELDRTILESLADPMTHMIRNCCDHAIETPEERVRAGKPETGQITLAAYHEAGRVNVEIRDDGRGMDPELVRKKVLDNQLKTAAELDGMSEREILDLIFLPGFTTVDEATDVSGRGVGMDVVKTQINRLGGSFDIDSTVGKGTTIYLRLPLTLAIIPCLIVTVGENRFAIPQINLEELVCLYDEDVKTKIECAHDQEVYRLRDRLLPMVRLSEVLTRPTPFTREVRAEITEKYRKDQERAWQSYVDAGGEENGSEFTQSLNFAVLKAGNGRFGLIVDQILGTEEIVVKPMHWTVKSLSIYSGTTIMGDGKTALILDVEGMAAHTGIILDDRSERAEKDVHKETEDENVHTVLLFKYGAKEQFAMSLTLIRRVEPFSISDIEQVGEREYVTVDGTSTLLIRLDRALSVSPAVEREEMFLILPKYIKRPVALLASSLIDIEKTPIELNVDSYVGDGLLGTAVVRDSMTLFIDIYRLTEMIEPEWFADRRMDMFGTAGPPPDSPKRILLLEDGLFFRHLVKGYLEADGYQVTAAENGQVGLDCMNEFQFDLIVSDLDMPVMDGWEFLKRVREGADVLFPAKDIPAMALTALDSESDRKRAMECGFNRYEVKIERESFLTSVAELLGLGKKQV
jgi:two-component system chemotaxis sensor kinase CheA